MTDPRHISARRIISSTSEVGEWIREVREEEMGRVDAQVLRSLASDPDSSINRCTHKWQARLDHGWFFEVRCVLKPNHDNRCRDRRGNRGPA